MGKWRKGDSSPPRGDDDGDIGSAAPSGGRAAPSGWQPGVPTTGQTRSKSHTLLAPKPSTPWNSRHLRVTKPSPLGPPPAWSYLGPEAMVRPRTWPEERCASSKATRTPAAHTACFPKPALGVRGSTPEPRGSGPEAEQVLRRHWRSVNTPGCSLPRASLPTTPCTGDSSCGSCTQRPLFLSLTHSLTHMHNRPLSQARGDEHGPLSPATCAFSLPAAPRPCGFGPVAQGPFSRLKRHGGDGGLVGRWRGLRGVFTPVVGAPPPSPVPPVPPGGPQNCWGEGNTRPLHPALGPAGLVDSRAFLSAGQPRGQEAEDAEIEMHSQPVAPFAL